MWGCLSGLLVEIDNKINSINRLSVSYPVFEMFENLKGLIVKTLIYFFVLITTYGFLTCNAQIRSPERNALKDIKKGWNQELIYEQTLVSPQALAYDDKNKLYVYEYGRKKLFEIHPPKVFKEVVSTGPVSMRTMIWQPRRKRLVGFAPGGMYQLLPKPFQKIKDLDPNVRISTVAVNPDDDSIYAAYDEPGNPIVHLNRDGKLLGILRDDVQGCSQLVYDNPKNRLYYSESFKGSISYLDLQTGKSKQLISNIGIPGTIEPIMIWFDGNSTLWYYTATEGLNMVARESTRQIASPMMGAGQVTWSPAMKNWIGIEYAGANLVTFDYEIQERVDLTSYLNADDIAHDKAGRVFFPRYEFIYTVKDNKIVEYAGPFSNICQGLEVDNKGHLYILLQNGDIYKKVPSGKSKLWTSIPGSLAAVTYNANRHSLIAATRNNNEISIFGIDIMSPEKPEKVATFEEMEGPTLKRLTTDKEGNIYLLDWGRNAILKVDERKKQVNEIYSNILASRDITTPGFEYSSVEDAFIIGTLEYYRIIHRKTGMRGTLAMNNHGADNFAIHENPDGSLLFIHSGQIFKLIPN